MTSRLRRGMATAIVFVLAALALAGCGTDPSTIGPTGIDGGVSSEQQKQDYVDGVTGALAQLATAQGQSFGQAVAKGNKRQLQASVITWRQGVQQLKALDPPKDAVAGHQALLTAVEALDGWNQRIASAAPNARRTKALATQAATSSASRQYEAAVCQLVDAGYEVVDPGACTPLANAEGPSE